MKTGKVAQLRQPISQKTEAIRALNQVEDLLFHVYDQQPVGADWRAVLVTVSAMLADVKAYIMEEKDDCK